jgi:hypothetical protein
MNASMDILYIALTLALFAASWWFVRACALLAPPEEEKK